MPKKLLFNFNREVIQDYTYIKYSGTIITATNTLEKPIKCAILTGSTKYRDIDTGEVLDTFDEGRNLELVSVKMPVLTTTGSNLFSFNMVDDVLASNNFVSNFTSEALTLQGNGRFASVRFNYSLEPNTKYVVGCHFNKIIGDIVGTERVIQIENTSGGIVRAQTTINDVDVSASFTTPSDGNVKVIIYGTSEGKQEFYTEITNFYINKYESNNGFEPYKSNILTVNEDVTLRSNGSVCDELDLLTGKLTQRIDEDGEILAQEVVKTVDLSILDQNENKVSSISSFNDTTHITASSETIPPIFEGYLATKEVE